MVKEYNNDSIKSLGVLGGVREKPASIGIESHNHTFIEILANSIDEANAGYGDRIEITKNKDGSLTIRDYGRGVPMDKNKDGEYSYKKVFDELWSGGKYDNNESEDGNYKYSLGTNGLGATASNYTSDFFTAISYHKNRIYQISYKKGIEEDHGLYKVPQTEQPIGTSITWKPSSECFRGNDEIDDDFIIRTLEDQSIVNGGLRFIFINNKTGEEFEYYYENGISDYIRSMSSESNKLTNVVPFSIEKKGRDNEFDVDYKIKADILFSFNREVSFNRYYHNSSWLENGGTPEDFIKNSFTFVINKLLKDKNLYKKDEKKISFEDISDSLIIVTSTYSTISLFTDQTKKKISSDFMKKSITEWLREQLDVYFIENPLEAEIIAKQVLVNKRSREKAETTRMNIKKKLSGSVNNLTGRVEGFVNCKSKDNSITELHIVEGKSALGSTKQGRDAKTQAIYALRGKILNCLKSDYNRIFANDIIVDLIKLLGCGVEIKSKNKDILEFNLDNLKWDKIIIVTDSDVDGQHIRTLILTMIYVLMPTLIKEGKIYISESPLYEIEKDGETYFAYSESDKDAVMNKIGNKNVKIQRSKGLGENTAEMMWETTMNPKTRKLIQITEDDVKKTSEYFDIFLGDNVSDRKEYIANNLYKYINEAVEG